MIGLHTLYGLSISEQSAGLECTSSGTVSDVRWLRHTVESLPPFVSFDPTLEDRLDGTWTLQSFGTACSTYCSFETSPDGTRVVSRALPCVAASDLYEIFIETVMRTILYRMGLASFHAAALSSQGQAVLLMAAKGAGKSTLSAAMQQCGWTLLADDLVRVRRHNNAWCAIPGVRRTKLNPNSLLALGKSVSDVKTRWTGAPGVDSVTREKYLLQETEGDPAVEAPIVAILCLQPRLSIPLLRTEALPNPQQVLALAEHLTRDPTGRRARPSAESAAALSGLIAQTQVLRLTLPDRFEDLLPSAASLGPLVLQRQAAR